MEFRIKTRSEIEYEKAAPLLESFGSGAFEMPQLLDALIRDAPTITWNFFRAFNPIEIKPVDLTDFASKYGVDEKVLKLFAENGIVERVACIFTRYALTEQGMLALSMYHRKIANIVENNEIKKRLRFAEKSEKEDPTRLGPLERI
jgi:hypothetical protein